MPLLPAALLALALAGAAPPIDGDWDGGLDVPAGIRIPLTLHLHGAQGTLDSPDQNANGVPVVVLPAPDGVTVQIPSGKAEFKARQAPDGALEGLWTQGSASFPARFVHRAPGAAAPAPDRPQTPRAPFPYGAEEVAFAGGATGVTLAGTLTRPLGGDRAPAVLLISGSGPQTRDEVVMGHRIFLLIADRLTRAGFAVLRYDKRGVGASTGAALTATGDDYVADATAALAFLRGRSGVDASRVGLLGHSEGAEVAPEVALRGPAPAFLVLIGAPGVPGVEGLAAQIGAIETAAGLPPARIAADVELERRVLAEAARGGSAEEAAARVRPLLIAAGKSEAEAERAAKEAGSPWLRVFLAHDPAPPLRRLKAPVLAVYGGKDLQVPPAANAPPLRAALSGDALAEVVELPGLNHLLQPATTGLPGEYGRIATTVDPKALELIVGWAARQARLPAPH